MKRIQKLEMLKLFEFLVTQYIKQQGGTVSIAQIQNLLGEGPPEGIVHQTVDRMLANKKLRLLNDGAGRVTLPKLNRRR